MYTDNERVVLIEWHSLNVIRLETPVDNSKTLKEVRLKIKNLEQTNRVLFIEYAIKNSLLELYSIGRQEIIDYKFTHNIK
jgi:hypothetical protein